MTFEKIPEKWNLETDVVIIGAGNAGLPAAIAARDKGVDVILLEAWGGGPASSLSMIAGGTVFSGTDFQKERGIEDSDQQLLEDGLRVSHGDEALWKRLVERQLETYYWLTNICGKPVDIISGPGHNNIRVHRFKGHGVRILKTLRKFAEEKGAKLLLKHRAERLYVDQDSGRVIGVKVKTENGILTVHAKKAVIITTGGFIANRDFIREYNPYSNALISGSPPSHKGDGLKMGLDIGAATEDLGAACAPSLSVCTETKRMTNIFNHGAVCINQDAHRWCDEFARPYNKMQKDCLNAYPDGLHFILYDKKVRDVCPTDDYKNLKEYSANSIEELAKMVGLDPITLKAEIDQFNSDIDQYGYEKKFGRKYWGGVGGLEQVPKVDTPPFYMLKCKIAATSCKGGLKINTDAQVLDLYGNVIPGLYAAGEVTGGLFGEPEAYYPGILTCVGFTYGRIAGENASAEPSN